MYAIDKIRFDYCLRFHKIIVMVSRIANGSKNPKTCPRCGIEHHTYGTKYCRKCYGDREKERAHAKGVPAHPEPIEVTLGEKYGAWVTIEEPPVRIGGEQWGTRTRLWRCVCEACGEERTYQAQALTKLPGCPVCRRYMKEEKRTKARQISEANKVKQEQRRVLRRENARVAIENARLLRSKAALLCSHHPLYRLWCDMRHRCYTSTNQSYARYGGRGIQVCDEWRTNFSAFRDYCDEHIGPKPEGCSIDRIDNDGNYEPGNIRWATHTEQARNTRSNVQVTMRGETKRFLKWAEEYGLTEEEVARVRWRLQTGWEPEAAFTTPKKLDRRRSPNKTVRARRARQPKFLTQEQLTLAESNGISINLVYERVTQRGWPLNEALTLPKGTVFQKDVVCGYCGERGHLASSHPDYADRLKL